MSEILQDGQHPDADQLNAFAEHTLPAHEQQQTLAHLASCPACRQIVSLSLPPADESPVLHPAVRRRWFTRWHPAWAAVPAFALLLLVILFVRKSEKETRPAPVPAQVAEARKPAAQPPPAQPTTPGRWLGASASSVSRPVNGRVVDRLRSLLSTGSLPSGLAILSMASHGKQRLAIDTDHHLFLSKDEGRSWKAVPAPWKGRAVAVSLAARESSRNEAPILRMSSRPAAATDAALSGTITDPTGAVIPGVTVVATNSAAQIVRSVATDNHGQFRMEGLVPGSYQIEAQAVGFQTESFSAEVAPAQQAVADMRLRVGSAAQSVTVEASSVPLESLPIDASLAATIPDRETVSRFEVTTDDGQRWMSADGLSWTRE
jgi:Carboxypeptidase regulatory-like domain/Putative zinc-finger